VISKLAVVFSVVMVSFVWSKAFHCCLRLITVNAKVYEDVNTRQNEELDQ
jgi:hypothetical protein